MIPVLSGKHVCRIKELDDEHEVLYFSLKLLAYDWLLNKANAKNSFKPKIETFFEAMKSHFRKEEKFLETIAFPETEAHKAEHHKLEEQFTSRLEEGLLLRRYEEFESNLWELYESHIIEWDAKIAMPTAQFEFVVSPFVEKI